MLQVFDKKVQKHLAVHGGLEDGTRPFQFILEDMRIDEIAVVGQGIGPMLVAYEKRLGIAEDGTAGGGVAHMPHRAQAAQLFQVMHFKNIGNQAHALVADDGFILADRDAGTFLSPVLQGVEPEIGQLRGVRMSVDAEKPAGLTGSFVKGYHR